MKKTFIILGVIVLLMTGCAEEAKSLTPEKVSSTKVETIPVSKPVSKKEFITSPNKQRLIERSSMLNKAVLDKNLNTLYSISSPYNFMGERITFDRFKKGSYKAMFLRGSNAKFTRDCGCLPMMLGEKKALRCVLLVNLKQGRSSVMEMWQYIDGEWYWGYLDHHETQGLCHGER